ncbi:Imm42 family immunity protein [Photorhabdus aegyptia]|uniref:Immunity protein 23 n=1 Tax=Photorhabdus aegyptia TaxID=2805098 RepID=A0A022PE17_9GAMM|nr:Imm42 family immunity protein [Photorhabdus aegyptia]EYU13208.1 Immunity protein 23 [Photorhabdus aegyptia]
MIYGDPFLFSLQFDIVESWNSPDSFWKNGIFSFYLEGNKLFDIVDVFELRTTIDFYSNMKIDELACNDIPFDPITLYRNAEMQKVILQEKEKEKILLMACLI